MRRTNTVVASEVIYLSPGDLFIKVQYYVYIFDPAFKIFAPVGEGLGIPIRFMNPRYSYVSFLSLLL